MGFAPCYLPSKATRPNNSVCLKTPRLFGNGTINTLLSRNGAFCIAPSLTQRGVPRPSAASAAGGTPGEPAAEPSGGWVSSSGPAQKQTPPPRQGCAGTVWWAESAEARARVWFRPCGGFPALPGLGCPAGEPGPCSAPPPRPASSEKKAPGFYRARL